MYMLYWFCLLVITHSSCFMHDWYTVQSTSCMTTQFTFAYSSFCLCMFILLQLVHMAVHFCSSWASISLICVTLNYRVDISTPVGYQQQLVLAEWYQNYIIWLSFYCAALAFIVCLHIFVCFTVTVWYYPDFFVFFVFLINAIFRGA